MLNPLMHPDLSLSANLHSSHIQQLSSPLLETPISALNALPSVSPIQETPENLILRRTITHQVLVGGAGNDTLIDNSGGAIMTGGQGRDQFWIGAWSSPQGPSVVTDFSNGTDQLRISRLGATFADLTIQDNPLETTILDQGREIAKLIGIKAAQIDQSSFIFDNSDRAQKLQAALDQTLTQPGSAPGTTTAVVTPDEFTWKGASGIADLGTRTPMQADNIFNIGSITKTFTAATTLKIVEQGKISLDDTLGRWLPDIAQRIPDGASLTLRQLLNGTSGVYDFTNSPRFRFDSIVDYLFGSWRNWQPQELVAYAYGQPRFSGPASSSVWVYPNTGTILAGLMVEKATGTPFAAVMKTEILDPLGLNNTFFNGTRKPVQNQARGYEDFLKPKGLGPDGNLDDTAKINTAAIGSYTGGLSSTAQDLARFTQALLGEDLLKPDSKAQLLSFVEEGLPYEGKGFGLGIADYSTPFGRAWGKKGDVAGYESQMLYFPERNGAINIALVNRGVVLSGPATNPSGQPIYPVDAVTLASNQATFE
ncbi:serine hydrolase [Leptolyngbya sp. AN03gr2]|uniref:serine hydrolase domain-containing protein n=1 Tax=unclassified Leptolyngbya TaxID=2650499 RepID=UPI003D31494A